MEIEARAADLKTADDLSLQWGGSIRYSSALRIAPQLSALETNANADDADRSFKPGIVENRVDLFSELDLTWRKLGVRTSATGWYDTVYDGTTDNDSPSTFNPLSVEHDRFARATRDFDGQHVELLDAFVFGTIDIDRLPISFRFGRHTLLWGESLFFTGNGIAAGQAPVDATKALATPNASAKEVFLPVTQGSAQVPITDAVSLAGFYQLEWRKTQIPGVGSYFSESDAVDVGGERLFSGAGRYYLRGQDQRPHTGQFGLALQWQPPDADWSAGVYFVRYDQKTPVIYLRPMDATPESVLLGKYYLVYPEKTDIYGVSATTVLGDVNVAGEVSARQNIPLISLPQIAVGGSADIDRRPLYAVGDTLHAQISGLWTTGPTRGWDDLSLAGEVAGHGLLGVTRNPQARDPSRSTMAFGLRAVATPTYFQVAPGLDLTVPIGIGFNFGGRSPIDPAFNNNGANHGGDFNLGLGITFKQSWQVSLSYTRYYGHANAADAPLLDRDFLSLSVQRNF